MRVQRTRAARFARTRSPLTRAPFGEGGALDGCGDTCTGRRGGAAVFAAVVGVPLSGTPPPPPNRLRQDSRVSDVDSGGEFRIT
jgi:hypothetical protein